MSTVLDQVRNHHRKVRFLPLCLIAMGLLLLVVTTMFLIPRENRVQSALSSRGIHVQGTVTGCEESGSHSDGNSTSYSTCRVRFTSAAGKSVESQLAYPAKSYATGATLAVVFDPRDTGVVALASDLGFWPALARSAMNIVALVASVVMLVVGIAVQVLHRLLVNRLKQA